MTDVNYFTSGPAMVIYGVIAGYALHILKFRFDQNSQARREFREVDKKLFQEVLQICPSNSSAIELIKNHDFYGSFHRDSIKPFSSLSIKWEQPDKSFHDTALEFNRSELAENLNAFLNKLNELSSPVGPRAEMLNCLLANERNDFSDVSQETKKDIQELHLYAQKTWEAYIKFVKEGREKLRV